VDHLLLQIKMNSNIKWIAGIVGAGIVAALFIVWFVLLSGPSAAPAQNTAPSFGTGSTQTTTGVTPTTDATNSGTPVGQQIAYGAGKILAEDEPRKEDDDESLYSVTNFSI